MAVHTRLAGARAANNELDIRGMMTDEADLAVDRFLDSALMGKLNTVTIIHGKGTGALRKAVHASSIRRTSLALTVSFILPAASCSRSPLTEETTARFPPNSTRSPACHL